jgi:predicted  nucleic acid-binding Zn-ribbon protein
MVYRGKRLSVIHRCDACGAPRMARACVLCGNMLFSDIHIHRLPADKLRELARELDRTLQNVESQLSGPSVAVDRQPKNLDSSQARAATAQHEVTQDSAHGSDIEMLRVLVETLYRRLKYTVNQIMLRRKLDQFKTTRGSYQVGTKRSVRAISGGLPERNRRRH